MKIKAFTKVGLMKGEKWIKGVLLEEHDNIFVVETHGNKVSLEKRFVKPVLELEHDDDGKYPVLEDFVKNNWEELKSIVLDSVNHFFPHIKLSINEEEKMIECEDLRVYIVGTIKEIETISSFKEIPVWEITAGSVIPATRYEPEDYSETIVSTEPGNLMTARNFIDYIWKNYSLSYLEKYSCH